MDNTSNKARGELENKVPEDKEKKSGKTWVCLMNSKMCLLTVFYSFFHIIIYTTTTKWMFDIA
jgi:hypothetical protein